MTNTNTDEDRDHGQTYGEAVDEALVKCAKSVAKNYETAQERRAVGDEDAAQVFEAIAESLAREGLKLAEKRERMPFGIESAHGFGETMDNPTLTFLEYLQSVNSDE